MAVAQKASEIMSQRRGEGFMPDPLLPLRGGTSAPLSHPAIRRLRRGRRFFSTHSRHAQAEDNQRDAPGMSLDRRRSP